MSIVKKTVKKFLSLFANKYIFFESVPDLTDNPKPVFDRMMALGLHKKYKFVWYVSDQKKDLPRQKRVKYVDRNTRLHRIKFKYYMMRAKCLISCNKTLTPIFEKQKSFYLTHGTSVKSIHNYYNVPRSIDYIMVASEGSKSMMAYELNVDESRVVALGFPRNDVLTSFSGDVRKYFDTDCKKVIVWYPTFRQHKNGKQTGVKSALPILHSTEAAIELNEVAKAQGVLIVMKPHFAQDVSYIKDYDLSNIRFINDEFFVKNSISSYEFIAGCDALITDYSSVYFDYLLCNKPAGLIWEDIDDYRKDPGFAVDMDYMGKAAEKINSLTDFKLFLSNLSQGIDHLANEREEICRWANYATDGKSAERVTDFIIEKANL